MGSHIKQCKQCGRLYHSFGSAMCPECIEDSEKEFERIRDYIYENPKANVVTISKDTGVSEKRILAFLKEGRLTIDENNGLLLCESCGQSISTGRYCQSCNRRLEYELSGVFVPPEERKQEEHKKLGKMHVDFFDR